ncbi:MAG: transcriptional regulator [Chloroflexi bacterium]|nr:transcriptional regulator [Chloroflexota bacterium]
MSTLVKSAIHSPLQETLEQLDEVIHQKVRLGVMSTLVAGGEADFRQLKETLSLTDGNLSIHLTKLEEAGYISVRKEFVRKKPHTSYSPTERGRAAFQSYLAALERIVKAATSGGSVGG